MFEVCPVVEHQNFITPFDTLAEAEEYLGQQTEGEGEGEGEIFWGLYLRDNEGLAQHVLDCVSSDAMRETIKMLFGLDIQINSKKVTFSK